MPECNPHDYTLKRDHDTHALDTKERIVAIEVILYGKDGNPGLLVNLAKLVESFSTIRLIVYAGVGITLSTVLIGVLTLVLRNVK